MNNQYRLSEDGSCYEVLFSDGTAFLIDRDDLELVSQRTWFMGKRGYPVSHTSRKSKEGHKTQTLHRFLVGVGKENDIDHISGDKRDNRRSNLRVCTHQQNMFNQKIRSTNSSGYQGVAYHKAAGKYEAYINRDGKKFYLGLFMSAVDAAKAHDAAALKLHGEYASLNFRKEEAS